LQGARQAGGGDGIGDIAQRQVRGGQGDSQPFGGQQHDDLVATGLFGKKLV
jgi:hypothetical protein